VCVCVCVCGSVCDEVDEWSHHNSSHVYLSFSLYYVSESRTTRWITINELNAHRAGRSTMRSTVYSRLWQPSGTELLHPPRPAITRRWLNAALQQCNPILLATWQWYRGIRAYIQRRWSCLVTESNARGRWWAGLVSRSRCVQDSYGVIDTRSKTDATGELSETTPVCTWSFGRKIWESLPAEWYVPSIGRWHPLSQKRSFQVSLWRLEIKIWPGKTYVVNSQPPIYNICRQWSRDRDKRSFR